jgi:hypothetical protein
VFPYREEMNSWGDWVVHRSDLIQPFLEFIKPKYTIRYWRDGRSINSVYGISLDSPRGLIKDGASIGAFISQFQKYGGKELFLFGYDGDNSGYWRNQCCKNTERLSNTPRNTILENHLKDSENMNKTTFGDVKIYHIGKTNNEFMIEISISDMKKIIGLQVYV